MVSSSTLRRLSSIQARLRSGDSLAIGTTVTSRASRAVGVGPDFEHDALAGRAFEEAMHVVRRGDFLAVDRQQVFAVGDVDARAAQRGPQVGVPVLAVIDAGEAIAALVDGVIGAEQAALGALGLAARRRR